MVDKTKGSDEMTNSGLSEEKIAEIMDMMAWDPRIDTDVDFLYHYYGETASKSVFREDEILFRLAAASTFEDKMEGIVAKERRGADG